MFYTTKMRMFFFDFLQVKQIMLELLRVVQIICVPSKLAEFDLYLGFNALSANL